MGEVKPKLTAEHRRVLSAWANTCEDFDCLTFDTIASNSGVDRKRVRRIVRHLARKGLASFHRGLWTEDMRPAGSGYGLTLDGRIALQAPQPTPSRQESKGGERP